MPLLINVFPLLLMLGIAAVIDWRTRRIPNWLTLLIVVTGLANSAIHGAPAGLSSSLLGLVLGFGLLIAPYAIGAIGAGDVKMLAGIGAWLGFWATLQSYACASIAGMVIAIVQCAANGRLTQLISNSTLIVANFANFAQVGREHVVASGQSLRSIDRPLPWAVPALAGVIATVAMNLI